MSRGDALEGSDEPVSGKRTLQPVSDKAGGADKDEVWGAAEDGQVSISPMNKTFKVSSTGAVFVRSGLNVDHR